MAVRRVDSPLVDLVEGDALSMTADILVLPATAAGALGEPWRTHLVRRGITLPVAGLRQGGVVLLPDRDGQLAVAATVGADGELSTHEVIVAIAELLGAATHDLDGAVVVTPVLGSGVGRLAPDVSVGALVDGFVRTAAPGASLRVVVSSSTERDLLARRLQSVIDAAVANRLADGVDAAALEAAVHSLRGRSGGLESEEAELLSSATESATPVPSAPDETSTGRTRLVHDQPAQADGLGRLGLATEVASLLRELAAGADGSGEAFAVHLDAPWGAGKSSLVRFIGDQLTAPVDDHPGWTVIQLDAWRSSQLSPAWWALLGHLRDGVRDSMDWRGRVRFSWRRLLAAARRLWSVWVPPVLVAVVLVVLLVARVDVGATMAVLTGVVAFTVAIGGLLTKYFSLGSLQGARVHERLDENPMEVVAEQIWTIRRESPANVLLVLDDLDRCNERFAVELLDAVQTLLRKGPERPARTTRAARREKRPPALVVLAVGDGRWLRAAYEDAYKVFSPYVSEPGRPLGHLFLDKLFQLRIELPTLNRSQVSGYLSGLLDVERHTGTTDVDELLDKIAKAPDEVGPGSLDERMADLMSQARGADESQRQRVAEKVLEARRDDPRRGQREHHILEEFAELLPPNPRATKRFLMAYNVAFAARLAELEPPEPKTLALWTVVSTRWPALAEWVRGELPDGDLAVVDTPGHPSLLLRDPEVRAVVGSDKGGPLDRDRVLRCCGYAPPTQTGSAGPTP
jgi:hypothetical protein